MPSNHIQFPLDQRMGSSLEESLKINTSELSIIYAILFSDLVQSKQVHATKTRLHRHEACRAKLEGRYFPLLFEICNNDKRSKKDKSRERNLCSSSLLYSEWLGKKNKERVKEERRILLRYSDKGYSSCWQRQQPGSLHLHPWQRVWPQSYSTEDKFLLPGLCRWPTDQLFNNAFSFTEKD